MNYYELRKQGTQGPWEANTDNCVITKCGVRFAMIGTPVKGDNCGDSNTAIIAHCVNNFDKALEAMKELKVNVESLRHKFLNNRVSPQDFYNFENELYEYNNLIAKLETVEEV